MELYGVVWNCACFRGDFLERACKATSSFSAYDVEVGMQFHEKTRGWYWAVLGCCKECILNLCCAFSQCARIGLSFPGMPKIGVSAGG
jgi:hypothetical protein